MVRVEIQLDLRTCEKGSFIKKYLPFTPDRSDQKHILLETMVSSPAAMVGKGMGTRKEAAACVQCDKSLGVYWPGVCGLPCWRKFCETYGLDPGERPDSAFPRIDSPEGQEILERLLKGKGV